MLFRPGSEADCGFAKSALPTDAISVAPPELAGVPKLGGAVSSLALPLIPPWTAEGRDQSGPDVEPSSVAADRHRREALLNPLAFKPGTLQRFTPNRREDG